MKEAAGEANMTVITIVLIAIVLGVGTVIVNSMMNNSEKSSACSSAGGTWQSGKCYSGCKSTADGKMDCASATQLTCSKNATSGQMECVAGS